MGRFVRLWKYEGRKLPMANNNIEDTHSCTHTPSHTHEFFPTDKTWQTNDSYRLKPGCKDRDGYNFRRKYLVKKKDIQEPGRDRVADTYS
jgi:hypothetical protein